MERAKTIAIAGAGGAVAAAIAAALFFIRRQLPNSPEGTQIIVEGWFDGEPRPISVESIGDRQYLTPAAAASFRRMRSAAAISGFELQVNSAFRTMAQQIVQFRERGEFAAKPGRSPHQRGEAVDIETGGFGSPVQQWLTDNAGRFDFVPHPDPHKEPWHWEYRGQASSRPIV